MLDEQSEGFLCAVPLGYRIECEQPHTFRIKAASVTRNRVILRLFPPVGTRYEMAGHPANGVIPLRLVSG